MYKYHGYFIDDEGIYSSRPIYHNDVEYTYHVTFGQPDTQEQFNKFLDVVFEDGKNARTKEIRHLLVGN